MGLVPSRPRIILHPQKLMIRTGLFHSIEGVSKNGVTALEFETFMDKHTLVRFKDDYGRRKKPYEGKTILRK